MQKFVELIQSKCQNGFCQISNFVFHRPWTIIFGCVSFSLLLGTGLIRFKEANNVRDHFGAENAPSRFEYNVAREFFRELGGLFHLILAMQAADGGNLLRPNYIEKALAVEEFLQFGLKVEHDGQKWAYSDFCGAQCENSDAVQIFLALYRNWQLQKNAKMRDSSEKSGAVKLTYPSIDVFGNRIYLGNNFFQVKINNRSNLVESANLIVIYFPAIYPNSTMNAIMKKWEMAVWEFAKSTQNDPLLKICLTSEGLVSEEVRQTGTEAVPLMPLSLAAIIVFTVLSSIRKDNAESKGWASLFGLFCPLLSLVASFGLLFWCGLEFLPILVVVPFLVLAVGVDDVFIMLHCWAQTADFKLSLQERLGKMLANAGPSMAITSLTNWLSFTIGIWTPVPAIRIFCIFVSVAIFFAYLFQLFFYTAVMAINGKREECANSKHKNECKNEKLTKKSNGRIWKAFLAAFEFYVDFLMCRMAKWLLTIILIFYWTICAVGISNLEVGLTTEKLFHRESLLLSLYKLQTEIIFREGGQMAVFVNNPGNLRAPERITQIMEVVKRFEEAPGSIGQISTHLWLTAYLPFIGFQQRENNNNSSHGIPIPEGRFDQFTYKFMHQFISLQEYRRWSHFIRLGTAGECEMELLECVHKFFFTTSFRGAISWPEKLETVRHWRKLAAEFAHLNLTIYENDSIYADQLLTIPPITIQTISLALVCMCLVLAFFTPSLLIVLTGSLAVLSINIGVFGFLHFWSIDLDPISMMTTLMAIGLSVDFVAHISFHYYKAGEETTIKNEADLTAEHNLNDHRERLRLALKSIAWPMLQAGISTMLCVLVLALIRVYMVQVFVKVVLLVVVLGLVHGLLVLPIVYSAISPLIYGVGNKNEECKEKQQKIGPTKILINDLDLNG